MEKETQNLLSEAASEIKQLRKENEIMGSRLQVFDDMMLLLKSTPAYPGLGYKEDVLYKIEKQLEAAKESK